MNGAVWVLNLCDEIKLRVIPSVYWEFRISPDVGSLAYDFFDRCGDLFPCAPRVMRQRSFDNDLILSWEREQWGNPGLCLCEFTIVGIRLTGTDGETLALSPIPEHWRQPVAAFLNNHVTWR